MCSIDTHDETESDTLSRRLILLLPLAVAMVVWSWRTNDATVSWLLALPVAYFFLCVTSLFHEFTHRHNHPRCRIWAELIGTLILTPATAYRETHVRHHAYLNKPVDWELWPYSDPGRSRTFRRLFAWADILLGFLTSPLIYGRIYWSRQSPLSAASRRAVTLEYLTTFAFWGVVLALVDRYEQWGAFGRAVLLPWWLAGVLQTVRKFTEHLGMSSYDPLEGTRTVHGGSFLTRVSSYLNSDIFIHGPHHRSPLITADELHAFADDLQRQRRSLPFYDSYTSAMRAMLPHLLFNPGCGENATRATDFAKYGPPAPAAAR